MDRLSFSKEKGFLDVPNQEFTPDLDEGCIIELRSEEGETYKINYKIEKIEEVEGMDNQVLTFFDTDNPSVEVGSILYKVENNTLNVVYKQIYDDRYNKKGLINVGLSLLASYVKKNSGVEKIEGPIFSENPASLRSRLLTRDIHTNDFLPSFMGPDDETVITYLRIDPADLAKLSHRRLHL